MSLNIQQKPLTPLGYQRLTNISTAESKLTIPSGTTHIVWRSETDTVRFRDDGVEMTAAGQGFMIAVGDKPWFYPGGKDKFANLRVRGNAASAVLHVSYYK